MTNNYTFIISGLDITDWIREKPNLVYRRSNVGELIELPNVNLIGDNTKNVWAPGHENSIFTEDYIGESVKIYESDILIYEGQVRNVTISNAGRIATVSSTAKINEILNAQQPAYISTIKTFAEHSEDIYKQYGIEIDTISYNRSKELQEDNLLQCRVNIAISHNQSLMQIQQWLAQAGLCRHYFIGNIAYMDFFDPNETRYSMHTFTDSDIFDIQNYQLLEKQVYSGYEVITSTGTASKSGLYMVPTLDGNTDKPFIIVTPETGYNWGDLQVEISELEQFNLTVNLCKSKYTEWLQLTSVITIQSDRYGINKEFEIISMNPSSDLGVSIEGVSF